MITTLTTLRLSSLRSLEGARDAAFILTLANLEAVPPIWKYGQHSTQATLARLAC